MKQGQLKHEMTLVEPQNQCKPKFRGLLFVFINYEPLIWDFVP
jgi:hypothetical protein